MPAPSAPLKKDPPKSPPMEIEESESEFAESTPEDTDEMGSKLVSELDPDADLVLVPAPEEGTRDQDSSKTLVTGGEEQAVQESSEVTWKRTVYYRIGRRNID